MGRNSFEKKLRRYDVISFDIFETLIRRSFAKPSHLFCYINKYYSQSIDFYKSRKESEIEASTIENNGCPSFDEIYEIFETKHGKELADYYKALEQELELKNCQPNDEIIKLFYKAKEMGKIIIIVSDMYYSKEFLIKILQKCGISGYSELFVSSDIKKSKHSGEMFKWVKCSYSHKKIIHIGDSFRGDYILPKLHRVKSKHYKKFKVKAKKTSLEGQIIEKICYNNKNLNPYFNLGFQTLGLALFGFVQWLHQEVVKNSFTKIVFLSREGKLIKETFDIMFKDIETQYIYVSRRSTRCVQLANVKSAEDILSIYPIKKEMSRKAYFSELGIEYSGEGKITKEDILNLDEEILKKIKVVSMTNKNNLINYLKQEGVSGKIALCDIGWNGTMQDCLESLQIAEITGYYYALSKKTNSKFSYSDFKCIRPFVHLIENMFIANHGTTLGYELSGGRIEAILDHYELEQGVYDKIQEGALEFVKQIGAIFDNKLVLEHKFSNSKLLKLGLSPNRIQLNLFKNTSYLEGSKFQLFFSRSVIYYLFHPKKFKRDFYNSGWKIAFLQDCFHLKLPYYRLYKIRKKEI